MIEFIAQFVILFASLTVLMACAVIEVMVVLRMWHDFRPGRHGAWVGTIWAVLLFGGGACLAGIGAYTIATAAIRSLAPGYL
ncbi:MAG TPA: hypothetical protein ENH62_05860 [Marinobacter sp.]|uniref:Uncharacterized protein n=1 Tax=marine sediment metagenome TaxID=412755 RepID=A0A0F9T4G4_9ZZZZ|nr:hypothetical protein [Marinobacter sp.]